MGNNNVLCGTCFTFRMRNDFIKRRGFAGELSLPGEKYPSLSSYTTGDNLFHRLVVHIHLMTHSTHIHCQLH